MSILVTPDDTYTPPRVEITVSVEAGGSMQTVAVYRTVAGVKEPIRTQPATGLNSRTVWDYEMDYEVLVTYSWETSYASPAALELLFTEEWADLDEWTVTDGAVGSWAVSDGTLIRDGQPDRVASVRRSVTPGRYRVTFDAPPFGVPVIDFGGFQINTESRQIIAGTSSQTYLPGSGSWVLDITEAGISLVTTAGTYTLTRSGIEVTQVEFRGSTINLSTLDLTAAIPGATASSLFVQGCIVASGRLFVISTDNAIPGVTLLDVFDADDLTFFTTITLSGGANPIYRPDGRMAIDGSGRLVIIDGNGVGHVHRFTISGSGASTTLTRYDGWTLAELSWGGVAVDAAGNLYIGFRDSVQKFNSSGTFVTSWGSQGDGDSQFQLIKGVAVLGSYVYVVDTGYLATSTPPRIRKFTLTGTFVAKANVYPNNYAPNPWALAPVAVVASGDLLFVSGGQNEILVFSTNLERLTYTAPGLYIRAWVDSGRIYSRTWDDGHAVGMGIITPATVDVLTVERYGATLTVAETADPVTLNPASSWLIHPSKPVLSIPISYDELDATSFDRIGDVRNRSNTVLHPVLGGGRPIPINTGTRSSDDLELRIMTETRSDIAAMRAILADDLPLLIRTLPSWLLDFSDGFYQVGDVTVARVVQMYGQPARVHTLPLVAVASPDVDVEQVGWSWAALAAEFPTWDSILAAFASWADVLTNTRRPGF